jgi:hypothetical protein
MLNKKKIPDAPPCIVLLCYELPLDEEKSKKFPLKHISMPKQIIAIKIKCIFTKKNSLYVSTKQNFHVKVKL